MTGLDSSVSAIRCTSASTASVTSPSISSSKRLPWRTSLTPAKPRRGSAPCTALPCGSRISGLGMTSTTTRGTGGSWGGVLGRGGCAPSLGVAAADWCMSMPPRTARASPLKLEFPQSLAVYDDYASAQKTVDFLSDNKFPVEQCMIVGTDLKRIERITGRLTTGRVAMGGAAVRRLARPVHRARCSRCSPRATRSRHDRCRRCSFGALFGVVWALVGYAATRGQRDFSSVTQVVATRYEVLVEHKAAAQARELLASLPGALPNPFA